ncbi:MAG: bacteriochlorophyll 4-vinyl reductase [Hoeflea sp.]|nr:bacteriochlorophyll 4-vinyl reductase [Hoeflea sp.]
MSNGVGPLLSEGSSRHDMKAMLSRLADNAVGHSVAGASENAGHRVGPNAIIQTRIALVDACGADLARHLFAVARLAAWFETPPENMVSAEAVHRLNMTLLAHLDGMAFESVMADAGARTGRYILQNRIPAPARYLLQCLPAGLAARALLKAIRANAWTFAGNARVAVTPGHPAIIEISANPISVPGCPWHRAVFATLFARLLGKPVRVDHRAGFDGGPLDRFMISWKP